MNLDVFALSRHKLLKREDLLLLEIPSYSLTIEHKAFGLGLNPCRKLVQDVWVFFGEIFRITRENSRQAFCALHRRGNFASILFLRIFGDVVYLSSFAIVFVLTCEIFAFKPIKYFCDRFRRLCQHGLERDTRLQFAMLA